MRPGLAALLLASALAAALGVRWAGPGPARPGAAPALPAALAERLAGASALPVGGIVGGTLALASCPAGVRTLLVPVFNTAVDPDLGAAAGGDARLLTFYAGYRLPESFRRPAVTALHFVRASGESFGLWSPRFTTETVVRFAVPRQCPPAAEAEIGRVMAAAG